MNTKQDKQRPVAELSQSVTINLGDWSAKVNEDDLNLFFNLKNEATYVPDYIDEVIHSLVRAQQMGDLDIDAERTLALIDGLHTVRERYEELYDLEVEKKGGAR